MSLIRVIADLSDCSWELDQVYDGARLLCRLITFVTNWGSGDHSWLSIASAMMIDHWLILLVSPLAIAAKSRNILRTYPMAVARIVRCSFQA